MRHPLSTVVLGLTAALLTNVVPGQVATVTQHAAACVNPFGGGVTLSSALPIVGTTAPITLSGPRSSAHLMLLSTHSIAGGYSLSPYGSPCRLYADPNGAANIFMSVPLVGNATYQFGVPSSAPLGLNIYAQSVLLSSTFANTPPLLTSNTLRLQTGYEPDLTPAQIALYAPYVRLSATDTYFPMDPIDYIRISRFRHHINNGADQGYSRLSGTWTRGDLFDWHYYDIAVSFINTYGLNPDGTNRVPFDPNSGSSWNVFLEPDNAPTGDPTPTGSVPTFYYYRREGAEHVIQYWFFFGANRGLPRSTQGDWEHVTVHVTQGTVTGVYFPGGPVLDRSFLQFRSASSEQPVVYLEYGTHKPLPALPGSLTPGAAWDSAANLANLASQPWRHYAGAWGHIEGASYAGPLGPWHFRTGP